MDNPYLITPFNQHSPDIRAIFFSIYRIHYIAIYIPFATQIHTEKTSCGKYGKAAVTSP